MNHLTRSDGGYRLPRHAHLVVYDAREDGDLLTVYDCGAAQKPPSAQFIGHLVHVEAPARTDQTPTGYVVRLREGGRLVEQDDGEWVVRPA
jgi:hypothetical protein